MGLFSWLKNLFSKKGKPSGQTQGKKMDKILLVGINAYPSAPLHGCLNDIKNVQTDFLSNYPYFQASGSLRVLKDSDATTAAILDALQWLIKDVAAGSRLYFHYSGHGVQVPGNEEDGLLEAICPVDFDWSPARMITDKQFVQIFSKIPTGALFNWCSDSCHSGDLDRKLTKPNHINLPRRMLPPPEVSKLIEVVKQKGFNFDQVRRRAMVNGQLDVGFVSGCRSNQTSADTSFNNQPEGAFTHFFLEALRANRGVPLTEVAFKTATLLNRSGYEQIPQCEGARAGKPLLG